MKWIWTLLVLMIAGVVVGMLAVAQGEDAPGVDAVSEDAFETRERVADRVAERVAERAERPAGEAAGSRGVGEQAADTGSPAGEENPAVAAGAPAEEAGRPGEAPGGETGPDGGAEEAKAAGPWVPAPEPRRQREEDFLNLEQAVETAVIDGRLVPVSRGPVALWRFGPEARGETEVSDKAGDGGPSHPANVYGNVKLGLPGHNPEVRSAAGFDGATGYITADSIQVYNNERFAISFWVRSVPEAAQGGVIYSESSRDDYFLVGVTPGGERLRVAIQRGGVPVVELHTERRIFDGRWHYVWVFDRGGHLVVNVDGQVDAELSYNKKRLALSQTTIGAIRRSPAGSFFGGGIDEVALFRPESMVQVSGALSTASSSGGTPMVFSGGQAAGAGSPALADGPEDPDRNPLSPFRP